MMDQVMVHVREASGVADARRRTVALTQPLRWSEAAASTLALAVTEVATNLVKHGGGGTVLARAITTGPTSGVEVVSIDKGRGIGNVAESMRDGYSTAGSPGLGLGSLTRVATSLEIYSRPGAGTALRFEVWSTSVAPPVATAAEALDIGVVAAAKPGQSVSGDAWSVHSTLDRHVVLVVDGLGHGPEAASASRAAVNTLAQRPMLPLTEQVDRLHGALRPTRGAAASLASIAPSRGTASFCGIGNVSGAVRADGRTRMLVSHNGTLGHQVRKVQEFDFPMPRNALLILHSDGLSTSWSLDRYPGLDLRHPALVAAVLFRDHQRGTDDATIVAVRVRAPRP